METKATMTTGIEPTVVSTDRVPSKIVGRTTELVYVHPKWQGVTVEQFHGALKKASRSTRGMSQVEPTDAVEDCQDLGHGALSSEWPERKRR